MSKLILITGGSASGKTTVAESLKEKLGDRAILISQDNFYKDNFRKDSSYKLKESQETNYDEPDAFDFESQNQVIQDLLNNKKTKLPVYSFKNHQRAEMKDISPAEVIIFEGLFTFFDPTTFSLADLKIFIDTPADTRLGRRVLRDVSERGRELEKVLKRWNEDVQPSYKKYIEPRKKESDVIIPWTAVNKKSIQTLIHTIEKE